MMRKGQTGSDVRNLQTKLMRLGYPMPKWGADGDLGDETLAALSAFLRDHKGAGDPYHDAIVSDNELALVESVFAAHVDTPSMPVMDPNNFFDSRKQASRAGVYGQRSWKEITGICLHQTACVLGERVGRWDNVNVHLGATRGGKGILLHDFTEIVAHGNGWNNRCVGLEMDGLYAGVQGDSSTVWNDPSTPQREVGLTPTPELVSTSLALCRWTIAVVKAHGGEIKFVVAHRQASDSRRDDPGSTLWKEVALVLHAEFGLTDGFPTVTKIGSGYPIPEAWDSSRVGVKY